MDTSVKDAFVLTERTRSPEQRAQYEDIERRGICPFCPEHLSEFHKSPILQKGSFWNISHADWPYSSTKYNFLLVSNLHAESLADLPDQAGEELLQCMKWAEKEFGIRSGVLGFRFGEAEYNGASVRHLHCQIFVADPDNPNYKTPRLKMGPTKEELETWIQKK